jgi:hypothetical protein
MWELFRILLFIILSPTLQFPTTLFSIEGILYGFVFAWFIRRNRAKLLVPTSIFFITYVLTFVYYLMYFQGKCSFNITFGNYDCFNDQSSLEHFISTMAMVFLYAIFGFLVGIIVSKLRKQIKKS